MCIYCNTSNYRKIYEHHVGPIPVDENNRSYEIHHIDGDHNNNNVDNLKCVSIQEHYAIHYAQGDWAACYSISQRLKLSADERSAMSRLANLARVENGTHHFLNSDWQSKHATARVANGTHHFLGENNPCHARIANSTHHFLGENNPNYARVANGSHNFLGRSNPSYQRVANGTHHFLGSTMNNERIQNGTHNLIGKNNPSHARVADSTHNFLGENNPSRVRVAQGTHHFQDRAKASLRAKERLSKGGHPFQNKPIFTCSKCNRTIKGRSQYNKHIKVCMSC